MTKIQHNIRALLLWLAVFIGVGAFWGLKGIGSAAFVFAFLQAI